MAMAVNATVSSVSTKYGRNFRLGATSRQPSYTYGRQHAAANPHVDAPTTLTTAKPIAESTVVTENLAKLISNRTYGPVDGDEYGRWFLRRNELRRGNGT